MHIFKSEPLFDHQMQLGEGPLWDVQTKTLYWVDIPEGRVHRHDFTNNEHHVQAFGQSVGMCVLSVDGALVAALEHEIVLQQTGQRSVLAGGVEPDLPNNRFNDGKCDAAGRLLAGTMDTKGQQGKGSLYILEEGQPLRKLLDDVTTSNGLGWSPDNKYFYYVDTPSNHLWRFDYDLQTGNITNRTPLIDYTKEEGKFDGLCVDSEGMLWVAHWGGYQVSRWDPATGRKIGKVEVPAPLVTSCCFGGEKLDTLYITTARGWDEQQIKDNPLAGSLFTAQPGVSGMAMARFGRA